MINAGDTAFVLISAALVCLMTPGLAFFYGGLVKHNNVLTIMAQNFISMGMVTAIWFLFGFSLAFGPDVGGIIGNLKFSFLQGVGMEPHATYGATIPFMAFFTFQQMFAIITPALMTGAFADRVNFKSYLIFLIIWSVLIYIPITHWVWGGGFLAKLGAVDFAGGIVVHASAGMASLASIVVVGKRFMRSQKDTIPHNIPYVALGTGLLWFGWFGFNGGSALAANGIAGLAFLNTDVCASVAMITWLFLSWIHEKRPSFVGTLVGAVAGLATITPAAGYVPTWAAAVMGVLAGLICYLAVQVRNKFDWDDALDVWAVHGVGGMLGSICVGIFAYKGINGINGIIHGDFHQLWVQCLAVFIVGAYAYLVTYFALKLINVFTPIRVSKEEEQKGLDDSIHQESAYNF